ncbi:hypothetical protein J6590_065069 [Homalodisca vitripennis]|nr:hypothetical protein J6590_065069 [Homalodisca vitripennis]
MYLVNRGGLKLQQRYNVKKFKPWRPNTSIMRSDYYGSRNLVPAKNHTTYGERKSYD